MSRKWLLSILTGLVLTVGGAAGATAAEALPLDPLDDPVEVEADGVGSVAVEAETEEPSLSVSAEGEAEVPEAETTVEPTVDAEVSPDGLDVDLDGDTEVAGEDVPEEEVTDPAEGLLDDPASRLPESDVEDPTGSPEAANDGEVRTAPAPAPAGPSPEAGDDAGDARTGSHVPAPISADRAAVRAGIASQPEVPADLAELAPEVAPPLLAAAASEQPPVEMALPVVDTTPTIPALLRLLAGLMVMGAAVTWKTVNDHAI